MKELLINFFELVNRKHNFKLTHTFPWTYLLISLKFYCFLEKNTFIMDLLDIFSQHRLRWFKGSKLSSSPFATLIISRSLRCRAARVVKSRQLPVWTRAEMTCQGTSYVQPRPHRK